MFLYSWKYITPVAGRELKHIVTFLRLKEDNRFFKIVNHFTEDEKGLTDWHKISPPKWGKQGRVELQRVWRDYNNVTSS